MRNKSEMKLKINLYNDNKIQNIMENQRYKTYSNFEIL